MSIRDRIASSILHALPGQARATADAALAEVPSRGLTVSKAEGVLSLGFFDLIGLDGITSDSVARAIAAAGPISKIEATINSIGGFGHEGLGIYHLLRAPGVPVETRVVGVAFSAASLIAVAGSLTIETGALLGLSLPVAIGMGYAADLLKTADELDRRAQSLAEVYAERSGRSPSEMLSLMEKGAFFDHADAQREGFASSASSPARSAGPATNFFDIPPLQRARLAEQRPEEYQRLRAAAYHVPSPAYSVDEARAYAELKPAERARLAASSPETYRRMRDAARAEGLLP